MAVLYGVDLDGEITPVMVRDGIIECFSKAQKESLEGLEHNFEAEDAKEEKLVKGEFSEMESMDVTFMVKSAFDDVGADFDSPTKEGLQKVVEKLKETVEGCRSSALVDKHYSEIEQLIGKL